MACKGFLGLLLTILFLAPALVAPQQAQLSNIVGQLRVTKGDFPSHPVLVELQFRGSQITSTYSDADGKFGFTNLVAGEYHLIINDESYDPVDKRLLVSPDVSGVVMALLTLFPRANTHDNDPAGARVSGSNAAIVDLRAYNKHFPKSAIKEYDRGVKADQERKRDDAILHYQAALKVAPDYYPAHNNLGSDYLSKSDFADARKEFEEVIRLNQSDSAGYFNLSNVCMMTNQLPDAQHYLDEGMRREPESPLGQFLLGSLDLKTGKLQQAEAALRQALRLSPTMVQARLQLANLMLKQGRNADAIIELRQFVSTFPDNAFAPKARQILRKLESSANSAVVSK